MQRRNIRAALAAAAVLALGLTGCSTIGQGGSSGAGEGTDGGAGGTVTIITHDSFAITDEQIAAFEAESGYTLRTTAPGDAGFVVNQLILGKDAPTVDGFYGVDNYSAQTILDEGVVAGYRPESLPASAEQYLIGEGLTPIDRGQVCLNVDHQWFTDNGVAEPTSFAELAQPEYAELLVVTDPATSSPGLAFLVATIAEHGEDGWQDYWTQLLDGGAKVAAGWSDAYYTDFSGADGEGPFPIVVSYSSSPAYSEGRTGSLDFSCTDQIEYAGVVEGAANPEGAQAFIDFMLAEEFQTALPENMYMYPIDDAIELPAEWAQYATLSDDPLEVDPATVAEHREQWITEWTELREQR
ncbi:MAG: thiamine ABC transporter substrate-binding protein [Microbacteriaceae bacterium]|nr:thiamine ABC transporter substrate-binding protein [Microbacteriaceae bacterium]